MDQTYLQQVESAVLAGGEAALKASRESAYGTSYDSAFKRAGNAGYHFSASIAFDLAVAAELSHDAAQRAAFRDAVVANLWLHHRQQSHESLLRHGSWLEARAKCRQPICPELTAKPGAHRPARGRDQRRAKQLCSVPYLGRPESSHSTYLPARTVRHTHFTIVLSTPSTSATKPPSSSSPARLRPPLWLFAQTSLRTQQWRAPAASILTTPESTTLVVDNLDLSDSVVVWETQGKSPLVGKKTSPPLGSGWIEAEAQFPDGRRVFARSQPPSN